MSDRISSASRLDVQFAVLLNDLNPRLQQLLTMLPTSGIPTQVVPKAGVYLFSEGERHLLIGRSNPSRNRNGMPWNSPGPHLEFALRLAREATGFDKAVYRKDGSQIDLTAQPEFKSVLESAKARVRGMDYRFIEETDQVKQALLETYAVSVLKTPYNSLG